MERRALLASSSLVLFAGCLSDTSSEGGNGDNSNNATTPSEDTFDGWVNEKELEDGYTVVHISADWEIVEKEKANDWDPDTVEISRRDACKRHFVLEKRPKDYEIYFQGKCSEGVTVSIHNADGKRVKQITLPEKTVA